MSAKENDLYRRALDFLYKRTNYETFKTIPYAEMEANLARLKDFLAFLGNPQRNFAIVHVAGTKGKGTVCASLERMLRAGGYKVGLFTSPHLDDLTERFQIGGRRCDKTTFAQTLLELVRVYSQFEKKRGESVPLTFFEWSLVVAIVLFARFRVDVAILEVGMGGKFDATNVCDADVVALTSVSFDHCEQLGDSLDKIATEKAGIIKSNAPVVCGVGFSALLDAKERLRDAADVESARLLATETLILQEDIANVKTLIRERAAAFGAPFYQIDEISPFVASATANPSFDDVRRWNFEIALKIAEILGTRTETPRGRRTLDGTVVGVDAASENVKNSRLARQFPVSPEAVRVAALEFVLPCRFEKVSDSPLVFVDGAHNRASVAAVVQSALERFPNRKIKALFATTAGKDVRGMLAETLPFVDELLLTERPQDARALPIDELILTTEALVDERFAENDPIRRKLRVVPDFRAFLNDYFLRPRRVDEEVLVAFGSFYFAAAVKNAIRNPLR